MQLSYGFLCGLWKGQLWKSRVSGNTSLSHVIRQCASSLHSGVKFADVPLFLSTVSFTVIRLKRVFFGRIVYGHTVYDRVFFGRIAYDHTVYEGTFFGRIVYGHTVYEGTFFGRIVYGARVSSCSLSHK